MESVEIKPFKAVGFTCAMEETEIDIRRSQILGSHYVPADEALCEGKQNQIELLPVSRETMLVE